MILLLIFLALYLAYKWSVDNFDYYEKIGVPFEKPVPLVGNMLSMLMKKESMVELTRRSYVQFKNSKMFGFFNFKQTTFVITDPELIKKITITDFDHFVNHNEAVTGADRVLARTLIALTNKEWRDMRTTLSPIFTSSKMKMMYELLSTQAQDFANFYEGKAKNGEDLTLDTLDVFARFTADGISTAVLGFEADCVRNKDSDVFKVVKKMMSELFGPLGSLKFMFSFVMPEVYKLLGFQLISKEIHQFLKRAVVDVMDSRDRKNISRADMIQLLLQSKKGQLKKETEVIDKNLANFSANIEYDVGASKAANASQFNDDDWIAQGFVFFAAGFDTTSKLLNLLCYELARNSEVQHELHKEIDEISATLNGQPISYEALHKMKFLDMIISESLRKWPPVRQTSRTCNKDYDVVMGDGKTVTITKGQLVFLPVNNIHHDPQYFPNPEKFDPTRFSDDNKDSIKPGTYFPFGSGPRACIGSRFSLMEAKLLLFFLLDKFSVEKCAKTPETITYGASIAATIHQTVYLNFKLRK